MALAQQIETPEAKRIDDSSERIEFLRSVGITEVPERDPEAFDELIGLLDDMIEGDFDTTKVVKELRLSKD